MEKITTIAVIGVGTLGKQIAERAGLYNYPVKLYDVDSQQVSEFIRIASTQPSKHRLQEMFTQYSSLKEAVNETDLVIEAVPENIVLKRTIFKQIDDAAPQHAIIETNSSSIPVSRLETAVTRKDKILNIHFYKLPDILMADIARGTYASDHTFHRGLAS